MDKLISRNKHVLLVLVAALLFMQGCSTSQYDTTSHKLRVNQDLANAWRKHGDEKTASSFEKRNEEIMNENLENYWLGDFIIDLFFK